MYQTTVGFRRALVIFDGSASAERVMPWLRRLMIPGGEVQLLTVLPPARAVTTEVGTIYADQVESSGRLAALATLGFVAGRWHADGVRSTAHVSFGEPAEVIVQMAQQGDVDVIALTAGERRPWWRWLGEDVIERVLRRSRVPVLVARERDQRGA
jgi:nucleotide-binding universal stress UspA family protein